ncbi:MAG: hypothetical protein AAF481_01805 [Acidobacteriota bacterium]
MKSFGSRCCWIGIFALLFTLFTFPTFAERATGSQCTPIAVDTTSDSVAALLARGVVTPLGQPLVERSRQGEVNVKESRQNFVIRDKDGYAIGGGTTTCTATCTGGCGISGCDPDDGGCTGCICRDNWDCPSCTCKKSTTAETAPNQPRPRDDVPRSPSFD